MKEINIPVLVLDDTCRTCEELDIEMCVSKLYDVDECVNYDRQARCVHIRMCKNIQKQILRGLEDDTE